ncbi:SRPBCC family protein [Halorubrum gandharaense]
MDELVVSTEVYAEPEAVYAFLLDFPRYGRYSEYLRTVRTLAGDGDPGTRYALEFAWWKLSYTAHSEVTGVEEPERIDWRITKDIDAAGCWRITPLAGADRDAVAGDLGADDDGDAEFEGTAAETDDPVCEVALEVEFDPGSASPDALDLPRLVSFDWVLKKTLPLIKDEAKRVVQSAVADLEGSERPVDLNVYVDSDRI